MENWNAAQKILTGQLLLILCCIVYLIWWSVSFRPGESVNRIGGFRGILLLITAACGMVGAILTILGINGVPADAEKWSGMLICGAGIVVYIALALITGLGMKRPITTELVLIVGWTAMELCAVNALNGAERLADGRMPVMTVVIAAAFAISMVLYILYYRMEAWKAFYLAMVPLITEGVSMAVLELLCLV